MRIPIKAAREIGKKHKLTHCFILGYDGNSTCVVTWGRTTEQSGETADWANGVKKRMGWPDRLCEAQPSRVRALKTRIEMLEAQLKSCEAKLKVHQDILIRKLEGKSPV